MWRWANGEIVPKLLRLTEQRCAPGYLHRLLRSEDTREVDFALNHVLEHHSSNDQFADDVFHILQTGERKHVALAIEFLGKAIKDTRRLHDRLVESCCRMNRNDSPMVLDYFAALPDLPEETLEGLTGVLDRLPYFQVHLILRMLDQREFFSAKAEADITSLLDSENFFIARRASEHLLRHELSDTTRRKLAAFREQNRDRL
jgi:hypothetical protein